MRPIQSERTLTGVPITLRGRTAGRLTPAEASVTIQGAGEIVRDLTASDITLFVDVPGGVASRQLVVQAESSPRYVVRSIAPSSVAFSRTAGRR